MAWQKASGYHWRALVEADISRFKRVIGDGRSRSSSACAARGIPAEGTIPHRPASRDRGRHRRKRAEPDARTRASGVRPPHITATQRSALHRKRLIAAPCNTVPVRRTWSDGVPSAAATGRGGFAGPGVTARATCLAISMRPFRDRRGREGRPRALRGCGRIAWDRGHADPERAGAGRRCQPE